MQSAVAFDGPAAGLAFLLGRVLFGGVLAFSGLNHFLDTESMVGYAQAKGVPTPGLAVPFTGGMLLFGGVGIALGLLPTLAAGALVVFLLVTTPLMHDFWAAPAEQQQSELINFLKNVAMLGGALAFLALSAAGSWPYAL
ncbi:DoxX family protein [Haloprofundus halobius]|uniref:DoxX family protein n=1 Tax=Haloprofundus halobius TaxID=2876194 RepID=UPI001CCBF513|nr:DoxX family protein [Haloprofundus halobius]